MTWLLQFSCNLVQFFQFQFLNCRTVPQCDSFAQLGAAAAAAAAVAAETAAAAAVAAAAEAAETAAEASRELGALEKEAQKGQLGASEVVEVADALRARYGL